MNFLRIRNSFNRGGRGHETDKTWENNEKEWTLRDPRVGLGWDSALIVEASSSLEAELGQAGGILEGMGLQGEGWGQARPEKERNPRGTVRAGDRPGGGV